MQVRKARFLVAVTRNSARGPEGQVDGGEKHSSASPVLASHQSFPDGPEHHALTKSAPVPRPESGGQTPGSALVPQRRADGQGGTPRQVTGADGLRRVSWAAGVRSRTDLTRCQSPCLEQACVS